MIKNQPNTVHDTFRSSEHVFYLTGSRYFGGACENSDWDYFVQDSREAVNFLRSLGYSPIACYKYSDPTINKVYGRGHIQVQLVQNAKSKDRIQCILKATGVQFDQIPKDQARKIWSACIRLYETRI